MPDRIHMSAPDVGELEEKAVLAAMRSGWIAPVGPDVDAFESELADRVGVAHAVAVSSGTAALHLGLLGLGVKPGDVVLTSTMTFAATPNAVTYVGAAPHFIDSEPATGNMAPVLLRNALEEYRASGTTPAAILPVDLLGKAVDYTALLDIAEEFGVPVLADAAESLGATHRGKAAGSFGRASVVSFNGNKIMTTSGGGMLLTDDGELAHHAQYLARQARQPVAHYEHIDIGYNYRLSNLLAALGRAQLSRLDEMIECRRHIRKRYVDLFSTVPGVTVFGAADDDEDNCWLTSILVDPDVAGWHASDLSFALGRQNIESRPLWKPMHMQPVFRHANSTLDGTAQRLFETGVTLPSGSAMSEEELAFVEGAILAFLRDRH